MKGGNIMRYDRCNDDDRRRRDNDCDCCLNIENSIVIIICGDIDEDRLRRSVAGVREARSA